MNLIGQSQTSSFGSRIGREHLISQNSPSQEGYRNQNKTYQNWGGQGVIIAYILKSSSKSCFGFVGGRDTCWLSSQVLKVWPKAHFLRELFLSVFLSETNVEERFSLVVI